MSNIPVSVAFVREFPGDPNFQYCLVRLLDEVRFTRAQADKYRRLFRGLAVADGSPVVDNNSIILTPAEGVKDEKFKSGALALVEKHFDIPGEVEED